MQMNPSINTVAKTVARCRAEGVRAYPDTVWSAIGTLRERYPMSELSRRLGISAHYLAKRLGDERVRFCELPKDASLPVVPSGTGTVTSFVVRRTDGSEMAVRAEGGVDLARVICAFAQARGAGEQEVRP